MKKFPWRSAFYLLFLLYLILDLKCCNGPLSRKIAETRQSESVTRERALELGWVALVNQEPVTESQLTLAVARYLYQRGLDAAELDDGKLRQIKRAALHGLISDILIRQYADGEKFEAPEEERNRFVELWESQFHDSAELDERAAAQGLTSARQNEELERIKSRTAWIEKRISPGIGIDDDEVRAWFDINCAGGQLTEPEKRRARHIFLSTVETESEIQEEKIQAARQRILEGEDFAEIAREVSEDERTKDRGGDLNWFSRKRLPADFSGPVFDFPVGQISEPFQTKIGWHIVEVLESQTERQVEFDEVKDEIRRHLLNIQTRETVQILLEKLRKVANIQLFTENFES